MNCSGCLDSFEGFSFGSSDSFESFDVCVVGVWTDLTDWTGLTVMRWGVLYVCTVLAVLSGCVLGVWTVIKVLTVLSWCFLDVWTVLIVLRGCVLSIWTVLTVLNVLIGIVWTVLTVLTVLSFDGLCYGYLNSFDGFETRFSRCLDCFD